MEVSIEKLDNAIKKVDETISVLKDVGMSTDYLERTKAHLLINANRLDERKDLKF